MNARKVNKSAITAVSKKGGLWAALFIVLFLSGCQSLPPVPTASEQHQLDVPFFSQDKYQCGPAALASMLHYAGTPSSPIELVDEVWLPERHGSLAIELIAAARARGLLAYPINNFTDLIAELDAGHPVLIQQNLLFNWLPQWHFAVVIGYADGGDTLILHSGTKANLRVNRKWFENHWSKADHVGYVMLPPPNLPANSDALMLASTIDDVSFSSNAPALSFWAASATRYPQQPVILFSYANAQYQSGALAQAIYLYRDVIELDPAFHPAWNNLASVLNESGCPTLAREAIAHALQLAPSNTTYVETRDEITASEDAPSCRQY